MPEIATRKGFFRDYLSVSLPQEWVVSLSEQTTCQGHGAFIRVESEPKTCGRKLICLIDVKENEDGPEEIIVIAPNIFGDGIQRVLEELKLTSGICLTVTECPLNCEGCRKAWSSYHA